MSADTAAIPYQGLTPGADANTYIMFSTVAAFPGAHYCALNRMKRLVVGLTNSQAGVYNWYKSVTRLTNPSATPVWVQLGTAVVPIGTTTENATEYLVEHHPDFKLEFVNGGVAQATWVVSMALTGERVKST